MPWKRDGENPVTDGDGNPIFVYPDGTEAGINFDSQYAKITELNSKLSKSKKRLTTFENTVKLFSESGLDMTDPGKITEFIETAASNAEKIENFNDADFIKADEVDKIKQKAEEQYSGKMEKQRLAYEKKLEDALSKLGDKDKALHSAIIKNAFLSSEFIRTKTSFPHPEIAYDYLKKRFKVEPGDNGEIQGIGVDSDGDPLHSVKDPSKVADINEAIEIVIKSHPQSSTLLIADGGGGGKKSSDGRKQHSSDGVKTVSRDNKSFINNLEGIAKGEVVRE